LDSAGAVLNRVKRAQFFSVFEEGNAVQYFYEPFLEAFDPNLRKELGVWYTPREVVKYMVSRVDDALRNDLGIASGLADPRVVVLDPCCGTGAFLVEVLGKIVSFRQRCIERKARADVQLGLSPGRFDSRGIVCPICDACLNSWGAASLF
jgi:predicted helicase